MHRREKTQLCASPLLTAHASSLPDLTSAVDLFKLLIIQAWRVGYSEGAVLLEFKEKKSHPVVIILYDLLDVWSAV